MRHCRVSPRFAEGSAAAALAAALKDSGARRRIGVIFTGGNVDAAVFARILAQPH